MGKRTILANILIAFILAGCTTSIKVSSRYSPTIMLDGQGDVKVCKFVYAPEGYELDKEKGIFIKLDAGNNGKKIYDDKSQDYASALDKKVDQVEIVGTDVNEIRLELDANQIKTYGLCPEYLDIPVDEFVTKAIKMELKFIGYSIKEISELSITGEILELEHDYLGFTNSTYKTKIRYRIYSDKKLLFDKTYIGIERKNKMTDLNVESGIYSSLAKSIEAFVRAAQGEGIL